MREGDGKVAIVVSHGSLARGLVSAMEKVLGPQPNVFWLSNTGKTPAALGAEIESLIAAEAPAKDVYLLTDLRGGSCATACLRTSRRAGVRGVFYGANLTLLLEFVLHQDLPWEEFFEVLIAKTRASIDGVHFLEDLRDSRTAERGSGPGLRDSREAERGSGAGMRGSPGAEPASGASGSSEERGSRTDGVEGGVAAEPKRVAGSA